MKSPCELLVLTLNNYNIFLMPTTKIVQNSFNEEKSLPEPK